MVQKKARIVAAAFSALLCGRALAQQSISWTGADTTADTPNNNWSDSFNWFPAPSGFAAYDITFDLSTLNGAATTSVVNGLDQANSVSFINSNDGQGMTLNGSYTLTVASYIFNSSPDPVVINTSLAGQAYVENEYGAGNLTLSGWNTYTGGTRIYSGQLIIGNSSSGTDSGVSGGPVGTGTLMLGSGTSLTTIDSGCYTLGNSIVLSGEGCVDLLSGGSSDGNKMLTLSGTISGAGMLSVSGPNAGSTNYLNLTSPYSTFSGGIRMSSGYTILAVGASSTPNETLSEVSEGPLGAGTLMLSNDNDLATLGGGSYTIGNTITLCGSSDSEIYLLAAGHGNMLTLTGMISGSPELLVGQSDSDYSNSLALTSPYSTFSGGIRMASGNNTLAVGASSTPNTDGWGVTQGPLGTGTVMLSDGNNFTTTGSGTYVIGNAITLCGGGAVNLLYNTSGASLELDGMITGSSALTIYASYTDQGNTVILTSSCSSFLGGVNVLNGNTTLEVTGTSGVDTVGPLGTGTLTMGDGTTLEAFTPVGSGSAPAVTIGNTVVLGDNSHGSAVSLIGPLTFSGTVSLADPSAQITAGAGSTIFFTGSFDAANAGTAVTIAGNGVNYNLPVVTFQGTYNYAGNISQLTVQDAAVIFDTSNLNNIGGKQLFIGSGGVPGYIGFSDNVDESPTYLLGLIDECTVNGVIGFDTHSGDSQVNISCTIDLTQNGEAPFTSNTYLGTATFATLSGTIIPVSASVGYKFTGVDGGQLTVSSTLVDVGSATPVTVGLPTPLESNNSVSSVTLSGSNSYSGGTTLNSGTLYVTNSNSLGSGALTVSPVNTSLYPVPVLAASGGPVTLSNPITVFASGVVLNTPSSPLLTLTGVISNGGSFDLVTIQGPVDLEGANTYSGGTEISTSGATVTIGTDTGLGAPSGPVTAYDSVLNFTSPSPTLDNPFFYGNTVATFSAATSPTLVGLTFDDYSTLNFNGPNAVLQDMANSDWSDTINVGAGATLTFKESSGNSEEYDGTLNGSGSIVLKGSGELDLKGANTYTGGTTVQGGVLAGLNDSAFGTGTVTVNGVTSVLGIGPGVTIANPVTFTEGGLGGYGVINDSSTFNIAGGSVVAGGRGTFGNNGGGGGGSPSVQGTLTFGPGTSVVFGQGGFYDFAIQNSGAGTVAGTDYSTLSLNGAFSITATNTSPFTIELISVNASGNTGYNTNFNPYQGYSWTLLTSASPITGFNASDFTVNTSLFNSGAVLGSQFSVTEGATDLSLVLNFTPVPEPSTWALMAGGVCMLSVAVLRRRRAAAARS